MPNQSLDRVFQALADPSRRLMVERLGRGPAPVSEMARPLAMKLPTVLQHLKLLEESGLVRTEKRGRERICTLEPAALDAVERWVAARRGTLEKKLDRLEAFLAETEKKA